MSKSRLDAEISKRLIVLRYVVIIKMTLIHRERVYV